MAIHLVCGYRGVGKDTFCAEPLRFFCRHEEGEAPDEPETYHQYIFGSPGVRLPRLPEGCRPRSGLRARRTSLAQTLKQLTHQKLGLSIPENMWDSVKDKISVTFEGKTQTLRGWYIQFGEELCAQDPFHFVKCTLNPVPVDDEVLVSDWRKISELSYAKSHAEEKKMAFFTWRIYRSCVPLPPADALLEFDLDSVRTDFLCVQSREEFERACARFPQYKGYVLKALAIRNEDSDESSSSKQ